MVRPIVKNTMFLGQSSEEAENSDLSIANDLLDTLKSHIGHCVGLAANMIAEKKRIIAVCIGKSYLVMLNPEIVYPPSSTKQRKSVSPSPDNRKPCGMNGLKSYTVI